MSTSYLKVKNSSDADEWYTTNTMVDRILPYIPDSSTVWCPFDKGDSNFVQRLTEAGINVIYSHIDDGQDFFQFEPEEPYDYIVSNPPFSRKDEVFERLFSLGKPFAMVMSMNNIFDSKQRYAMFSQNEFEILVPRGRTKFIRGGQRQNRLTRRRSSRCMSVMICCRNKLYSQNDSLMKR